MALIVTRTVSKQLVDFYIPEGASKFFIAVGMDYLSEPYHLKDGSRIVGEIIRCFRARENYPQLENVPIVLILQKGQIIDNLYISRENWDMHFREWGLVHPGYTLELKLTGVTDEKGSLTHRLYLKKDVSV